LEVLNNTDGAGMGNHRFYLRVEQASNRTAYLGNYDIGVRNDYFGGVDSGLHLWEGRATANATMTIRVDGVDDPTPVATGIFNTAGVQPPYLGSDRLGGARFLGPIAEAVIFGRVLNAAERTQMQTYFNRWGLGL